MSDELTPKQRAFVDHYLTNGFNATEAARAAGYKGNDVTLGAVGYENLNKPQIKVFIAKRQQSVVKKAERRIVNVHDEFLKNLDFVGKLRDAAREWLDDPEREAAFTLNPRCDEIDIVYLDYEDRDQSGKPKRKTANLQDVLAKLQGTRYESEAQFIKTVDLREYALKVVDRIDTTLDKFAKMGGEYTKDKENPADALAMARRVVEEAKIQGLDVSEAARRASKRYGVLEADLIGV